MENEKENIILELLQNTAYVGKLLSISEIAINDGDIESCQKNTKEAQALLSTLKNDSFKEFEECFELENSETNDYDLPNTLELIKQLFLLEYDLGILLGLLKDEDLKNLLAKRENQVIKDINTINEIHNAIFEN